MEHDASGSTPLITLFERDDAIAVPLLSQLRMAGYDVRASRTPVELFDILSKSIVSLVLVDLGAATAGRREFWVALDAQRRGRAIQVMTFRFIVPGSDLDLDLEPSARAIPDVEVNGAHEFQRLIDAVHQRVPLRGPTPSGAVSYSPNGEIQPLGAALGLPPTPFSSQNAHMFAPPAGAAPQQPTPWGGLAPIGVAPIVTPLDGSSYRNAVPYVNGAPYSNGQPGGGFPPISSMPTQGIEPNGPSRIPEPSNPFASPPTARGPINPIAPLGSIAPMAPIASQISAQMETTPFDGSDGVSLPYAPYGQPGGASASPFAHPTASNPFASNPSTPSNPSNAASPFAQPYVANPFSESLPPQPPSQPSSQPSSQPFSQPIPQPPHPPYNPPSAPNAPSAAPGSIPGAWGANNPPSWPSPANGGSMPNPLSWGSSNSGPASNFGYTAQHAAIPSQRSAPSFQDAWTPPDDVEEATGIVPEIVFQRSSISNPAAPMSSAPTDAWDTMRSPIPTFGPSFNPNPAASPPIHRASDPDAPIVGESIANQATMAMTTPTETALGGVLVEGSLLTPGKLETLKGIQSMLASVNMPRKLGELALMFKFLSQDQLLAALLVSRGLVNPQQIASLGRVKQELAASGMQNDLETLLVMFNILPAEKLREIREELSNAASA